MHALRGMQRFLSLCAFNRRAKIAKIHALTPITCLLQHKDRLDRRLAGFD
jgi:hypothetical protein